MCRRRATDVGLGFQLRGEPELGAAAAQPRHPTPALPLPAALTHHTLHLQEGG
jgi:hypothetical protein